KFLGARERGVDRQRPRRQTILARIASDRAKIAGAQERGYVCLPIRYELHPKTRKPRAILHRGGIDAACAPLEHRRIVENLARLAVDDLVKMHGLGEVAADMEELQAKRQPRVAPQRMVAA